MSTLTRAVRRRLPTPIKRRLRSFAEATATRLGVGGTAPAVDAPAVLAPLPAELTERGSRRVLPLPTGWTREQLFDLLATVSIEGAPPEEIRGYLTQDFERFVLTWDLVRGARGRALEIGANPYFTTVLLREFTDLELTLTNSFDSQSRAIAEQRVSYRDPRDGGTIECDEPFVYHSLNVEDVAFPWPDGHFDVVVFCEVIEHLLADPVAALAEIHRVLAPGGVLVVSTPNVARLENVARLAAGANMYDPYSGYGPYGRHNREYTRHELVRLLEFAGFRPVDHFTADVHPHATTAFADPALLAPLVSQRLGDLGQYLFCRAEKAGAALPGRPAEIYRSMPIGVPLTSWDRA